MTNKTNTFPKLTTAQERAWQLVLDWHDEFVQHASEPAEYFVASGSNRGSITYRVIPGSEATFKALVKAGMLVKNEHPHDHAYGHYSIHPDFVPEYFDDEPTTPEPSPAAEAWHERAAWVVSDTPEPSAVVADMVEPAAAPAQPMSEQCGICGCNHRTIDCSFLPEPQPVNNAPEFMLGDNVTPKEGEWAGRLCWICDIRHTGVTPMYLIRDKHGKCDMWFGAEELVMVDDPSNYQKIAPTNPTYDSLKALADKQDEYIQALEARVKELEGDMERLAASELELVQQNALLNSVVDRLGERAATLETENTELKAQLAENHIQTAEERAADWGKWNKGS